MTKLLAIMGSPRRGGNTDVLVDEAIDAFCQAGGVAEKVMISELDINPCRWCGACQKGDGLDTVCAQIDDMTELYQKVFDADAMIWATPIFMWSPTSQIKLFLDRLFPTGDYQNTRYSACFDGKPIGLIMVYAEGDPLDSGVFQTHAVLDIVATASGGTVPFAIHSTVGAKDTTRENVELVQKVRAAATKLYIDLTE